MSGKAEHLADLDELVLRCESRQARVYIEEAVRSYKAGAYRAAISSTWIAVVFDIIDKLRQLEETGHRDALRELDKLRKYREHDDLSNLLKFEREVLELAANSFGLLDARELADLARLREDRNRCAHPTLTKDGTPYSPTPELARSHLRNVVEHLLQHPPVQGRAAMEAVRRVIDSPYFPTDDDLVEKRLRGSALAKPRHSLVRNLFIVGLKECLLGDCEDKAFDREAAALRGIHRLHTEIAEQTLGQDLDRLIRSVSDDRFGRVVRFLVRVPSALDRLSESERVRLKAFIDQLDASEDPDSLALAIGSPAVIEGVDARVAALDPGDLGRVINAASLPVPSVLRLRALELYSSAASFDQANLLARQCLLPVLTSYSEQELKRIIAAAASNGEVSGSFAYSDVLKRIHELRVLDVRAELEANGLLELFGAVVGVAVDPEQTGPDDAPGEAPV